MEFTIKRLNHRGEGVAAEQGAQVIARVLPGEVVDEMGRILTPSPDRVKPPCRHYKSCGGCAMQHSSDRFIADWKTEVIRKGLAVRGIETEILPIATSPAAARRRAILHGRRGKKGTTLGFFARASDMLVDVPDCQLLTPQIMAARPALNALIMLAASRKSTVELVVIQSMAGLDIDLRVGGHDGLGTGGSGSAGGKTRQPLAAKQNVADHIARLAAIAEDYDLARLSWAGEVIVTRRLPVQKFGPAEITPPPGAFLQATAHGQSVLSRAVQRALDGARQVVDLFAGCGTFTFPAAQTAEVWALEGDAALIQALDAGWRNSRGVKKIQGEQRDLFRQPVVWREMEHVDGVIIDPPRAGAQAQMQELAASSVPKIAAVSCNPVSFARDAELLIKGGYRLQWIQPVDQFRWSSHVELVGLFTR